MNTPISVLPELAIHHIAARHNMYYYNNSARLAKYVIKSTHIFSPLFPKHLLSLSANMALGIDLRQKPNKRIKGLA